MGVVDDYLNRMRALQSDRMPWEDHWWDIARYTLPDAERFDSMFSSRDGTAIDTVVSEPVAAKRTREIYDMTSLWAVDRGASGFLSLVTPESETWHDIKATDPFAGDPTDEESRFFDGLRDYLFSSRANPRSGFWMAHKSAVRSLWAFGVAVTFIEETQPSSLVPVAYRPVPLSENHLGCDYAGVIDTNFRVFSRSASQCVQRWGYRCSDKVKTMANDPKQKDSKVRLLHAVQPRQDSARRGAGVQSASFESVYIEIENKHLLGMSGFWEFPFRVDHWNRNNSGPYAEGPVALALAEIKSLNMLAKQELQAVQTWVNPPKATMDDGIVAYNLNPGAMNPGALLGNGALGIQSIHAVERPDFARAILDARKDGIREALYVNLWQTLMQEKPNETATAAMIRSQEKADLLGPAGSSLQVGLSFQVEREIAILNRRGVFQQGRPLEAPASIAGKNIGVEFSSPLDRGRRLSQFQGMQTLAGYVAQIAGFKPGAIDTVDWIDSIDEAQEILGVPRKIMTNDAERAQSAQQRQQQAMMAMAGPAVEQAGNAATSAATGAQAMQDSPAAQQLIRGLLGQPAAA